MVPSGAIHLRGPTLDVVVDTSASSVCSLDNPKSDILGSKDLLSRMFRTYSSVFLGKNVPLGHDVQCAHWYFSENRWKTHRCRWSIPFAMSCINLLFVPSSTKFSLMKVSNPPPSQNSVTRLIINNCTPGVLTSRVVAGK